MLDYFGNTLCIGDRIAFVSNKGYLTSGQVTGFHGEEPNRYAEIWTDGKRNTSKQTREIVKDVL
jgi:hypothetical protein